MRRCYVICGSRSICRYPHRTCVYFRPSAVALTGPAARDSLDRPYGQISIPKRPVAHQVLVRPSFIKSETSRLSRNMRTAGLPGFETLVDVNLDVDTAISEYGK